MNWNLYFHGTSKMAQMMRQYDWEASVLGTPDTWSASLHSVLRVMLESKFPMFIAWGNELGFLYNDGYAEILGNKHPRALGGRFEEIWREIWQEISPIVDDALSGKSSYFEDLPLVVQRAGLPEDAWFTFSYSPIRDDTGAIAGMFCSVVETTRAVQERKLRRFQLRLADTLHPLTRPDAIVDGALALLVDHLGVTRAWYAQADDQSGALVIRSGQFGPPTPQMPFAGEIDEFGTALLNTLGDGSEFVCEDVHRDERTRGMANRFRAWDIGAILIVPVLNDGRILFTVNAAVNAARTWSAEDVRAARDVVDRTWVALDNAQSQKRLKYERDKSELILNQMGEGFILIGSDGRVMKINAEGLRILARKQDDVLGHPYSAVWGGGSTGAVETGLKRVVESFVPVILEVTYPVDGTTQIVIEMRLSPLKDQGVAVFFRNVTAQKHAALALRRSEEHLRALFEQTAAGIAERDLGGRLIRVNERLCQILGRSREELLGASIHDLTHPEDRARSEGAFRKLLVDGQPFNIEKRYVQSDGTPVWVSTAVSLISNVGPQCSDSVLSVILDISERKKAEQALKEESRILELLNESGQALAESLDLSTLLQTVTDSGRSLTGAQFGAFFYNGKHEDGDAYLLYALSGARREDFERFGHPRATPIFSPTFTGEAVIRSDDITKDPRYGKMSPHYGMPKGHLPVRSYLAAPVVSRSGEVIGGLFFGHPAVGFFTERSERLITGLAAQAALAVDNARLYELAQKSLDERQRLLVSERAARSEAERLNSYKDEFLAMLAHELRNPLAPVSAAAEVLRMSGNDANSVRQVSEIISRQIGHFTRLIDDLMDVSRVRRGLIQLQCEPLDLKAIIAAAVEQVRPMIEVRKHTLTTRLQADTAIVYGDRTRLVQVIANLLTNAAKYTPPNGEILLNVEADASDASVTVTDNGGGIEASLLPYVFDLFTQGARGLDRSQGGLGIGLALVKTIVSLHHGTVMAASEGAGKGSRFTVSLPLMRDESAPQTDAHAETGCAQRLAILVVDDNTDAANATAILLMAVGHQVTVASSARAALDEVAEKRFDVFILDIGLPDMSGYELAKTLRGRPGLVDATYFALTGYGQPQDRELSAEAGFAHHFVKPVNNQLLFRALAEIRPDRVFQRRAD